MSGRFDGAASVVQGPPLTLGNTVTYAAWIYLTEEREYHAVIDHASGTTYLGASRDIRAQVYIWTDPASGQRYLLFDVGALTTPGSWWKQIELPLREWHHVAVTYDFGSASNDPVLYFDGSVLAAAFAGDENPVGTLTAEPHPLWIGNDHFGGDSALAGRLQNVAVWSRILSAGEVLTLYQQGIEAVSATSLAVVYDLRFRGGRIDAWDRSGSGHDGTLVSVLAGTDGPAPPLFSSYYGTAEIGSLSRPYAARILEPPTITRRLVHAFFGPVEIQEFAVRLANADGALTPAFTAGGFRGQRLAWSRYDEEAGGDPVLEVAGVVDREELDGGALVLHGANMDLSVFETRIPRGEIDTMAFPAAIDVGKTPPVVIGTAEIVKLLYVNDGDGGNYDYLLGRGSITPTQVYREEQNLEGVQSFSLVAPGDFTITEATYPGYTAIRFSVQQTNVRGGLAGLWADLAGLSVERHPIRAIQRILSDPDWGLDEPVIASAWDDAAVRYTIEADEIVLDGALTEPRPAQEWLREIMLTRGIRMALAPVDTEGEVLGVAPVIEAGDITGSGSNTPADPVPVAYPAYGAGDLVVMFVACDDDDAINVPATGPNGEVRTIIGTGHSGNANGPAIAGMWFVGTASHGSGTQNWDLGASEEWVAQVVKVPAGEFDPDAPIDSASPIAGNNSDSGATVPTPSWVCSRPGGRVVVACATDDDPITAVASGWTQRAGTDIGQVTLYVMTRDAATTEGEAIASADMTIASDSSSTLGVVVNAPRTAVVGQAFGWVPILDRRPSSLALALRDGPGPGERTLVAPGTLRRVSAADRPATVRLRYGWDQSTGDTLYVAERQVEPVGRVIEETCPLIRDHASADRVVDYLAKRLDCQQETLEGAEVTREGAGLIEGDLVTVEYAPYGLAGDVYQVMEARKGLTDTRLSLARWSESIYHYGPAAALPTDRQIMIVPPGTPPTPPGDDSLETMRDTFARQIVTANSTYQLLCSVVITATGGNTLQASGWIAVSSTNQGGPGTTELRLRVRDTTSGQSFESAKSVLYGQLYYTLFTFLIQAGVTGGAHTVELHFYANGTASAWVEGELTVIETAP